MQPAGLHEPLPVDDTTPAAVAWRHACDRRSMLWHGDYHNARQLLRALANRLDRAVRPSRTPLAPLAPAEAFQRHRQHQAHRARVLNALLVPLDGEDQVLLRRAPDVRAACREAYGPPTAPRLLPLRELLGVIGAHEWRRKGVAVPALGGAAIHPHYGVFSPVRGEYVDLVARPPLPGSTLAFDIGAGTGVLSAVLLQRGVDRVVATDNDPRALACARDNLERLGLSDRVELLAADLFPPGQAPLVVCNPPWVPAKAYGPLDRAVYDPDSRMLRGFVAGLPAHLAPGGEGWLLLSDLAVHLGLRPAGLVEQLAAAGGLRVLGRLETQARHPKAADPGDPLHAARSLERTHLWRLGHA